MVVIYGILGSPFIVSVTFVDRVRSRCTVDLEDGSEERIVILKLLV